MRSSASKQDAARPAQKLEEGWLLLATTYAVIVSSALLLAVTERSWFYLTLAGVLCGGHALVVGPDRPAYIRGMAASFLAVGALVFGLLQSVAADVHISYGLAHFLLLAQLLKLYGPHGRRDLRLIQVAAVFQALVAGIWALELSYLACFALTAVSLMANMIAVSVGPMGRPEAGALPRDAREPGPWMMLAGALVLPTGLVFVLTAIVFVLLPRVRESAASYHILPEQVIGFSENVSLHEVGWLRQSQELALRARFFAADQPDRPPVQPRRLLMRGVSKPIYRDGQWFGYDVAQRRALQRWVPSAPPSSDEFTSREVYMLIDVPASKRLIRPTVTVESKPIRALFTLYRPLRIEGLPPYANTIPQPAHDVTYTQLLQPGESYEILAMVPTFTQEQLQAAGTPRPGGRYPFWWDLPDGIRPVLERTAAQIEAIYSPKTDYERVLAAQSYLLDPGRFRYTYDLPEFGDEEPIAAFLTTTREGSCEQFSTALALILRVWAIPTRLVVGFKGGEYDAVAQTYAFRDRDAHAWVEVFFNHLGWVEFDPTPGTETPASVPAGVLGGVGRTVERLRSALARFYRSAQGQWGASIVGYNRSQQRRLLRGLSQAAANLADQAAGIFRGVWPGMPDLGLLQIALLVASFTFVGMGLYLAGGWLLRWARLSRARPGGDKTLRFYQELLTILRRKGLTRPPHATPREFAQTAAGQLRDANEDAPAVLSALNTVTDSYCRARFGGYDLTETEWRQVREALSLLARARGVRSGGRWRRASAGA
jgi:transglutaminase-like putative cysteine protease